MDGLELEAHIASHDRLSHYEKRAEQGGCAYSARFVTSHLRFIFNPLIGCSKKTGHSPESVSQCLLGEVDRRYQSKKPARGGPWLSSNRNTEGKPADVPNLKFPTSSPRLPSHQRPSCSRRSVPRPSFVHSKGADGIEIASAWVAERVYILRRTGKPVGSNEACRRASSGYSRVVRYRACRSSGLRKRPLARPRPTSQ
jgi:hypothetical protein